MKDFPFLALRAAANSRGDLLQWPSSLLISNQLPNGDDITAHLRPYVILLYFSGDSLVHSVCNPRDIIGKGKNLKWG